MKILAPRELGHGILIEYDAGHVSPKENTKIIKEIKDTSFDGEVIMYCCLQKFDTPNRNGRVYPEKILKRENERYQDVIKRGSAISELNHPESSLIDLERRRAQVRADIRKDEQKAEIETAVGELAPAYEEEAAENEEDAIPISKFIKNT